MCGIAGFSLKKSCSPDEGERRISRMISRMRHRGPDDCGFVALPSAAHPATFLANTRLAIQDLTLAGHQPMCDHLTGNWIVFNGEIYNHQAIRRELGNEQQWQSSSDTETILRAYAKWGKDCVLRLRGMFAFVLYDALSSSLWCVRDRLGIKPFYYACADAGLIFASELTTVLESGLVERSPDLTGIAEYIRYGSVSEPFTPILGIRSLPAGYWLEVVDGELLEPHCYWSLDRPPLLPNDVPPEQCVRELLKSSVREHMLSDVPVASFLSGGIDSSVITALAATQSSHPIRTFTVAMSKSSTDESRYAAQVAERYGTDHHEIHPQPEDVVEWTREAVGSMDLPTVDGINVSIVSRAVAQAGVKVVLSGLGGDELFGGYRSFRILPFAHRVAPVLGLLPSSLRRLAPGGRRAAGIVRRGLSFEQRYDILRSFWSEEALREMQVWPHLHQYSIQQKGLLPFTAVSVLELSRYMKNVLLRDCDGMSMAHSVETRVPFLDHRVVEYCLAIGAAQWQRKELLLRSTSDLLPPSIYKRKKQGFDLPMDEWMRGPLSSFVDDGLKKLEISNLLPAIDLPRLRVMFTAGKLSWARLWQMAVLGQWMARVVGEAKQSDVSVSAATIS